MPLTLPPDSGVPPPSGKPGGIGEKLEQALVRFVTRALNGVKLTLSGIIRFALDTFLEGVEPFMIRAYTPLLSMVKNQPGCPSEVKTLIDHALSGESQAGAAVLGLVGNSLGGAAMGSVTGSLFAGLTRFINVQAQPARPDIGALQAMVRRGLMPSGQYYGNAAEGGWSPDWANLIFAITQPRPDIGVLVQDAFRKEMPIGTLRPELVKRGFSDEDINAIMTVAKPIPGAGDLISMAVREAWDDGVAARFGYDADFPAPFAEWMHKQGFDPEWAQRWWRAHWTVPGPTLGAEMLHRTSMTEADYATLLKVADYPQQWRQWMTEVAYAPYTRVDIRRMFQVGVLTTYAELVRAYQDIGYKLDKATKLADFTVLEYGESEREATKVEVLSAYGIGRLSEAETRQYLVAMGYPGWVIDTYIARVDLGRANGIAGAQISHAQTMYVNGQMSRTDVYTALNLIPLASAEIERYLQEWEISRAAKVARPSRADLLRFFLQNEMSEAEFRQELAGFRLSTRYVDWYVADAKRKLVLHAEAEAEAAQAEAEKVRISTTRTTYDIQIADINVQIARLNLTIAELKASSSETMSLAEVTDLGATIVGCQVEIKELQVAKAQLYRQYLESRKVV
jgi:hypothetical protein